jgi:hypothetical protein
MLSKYERAWQTLAGYEEDAHWPLLSGPGFSAATHPGAENVFVEALQGVCNLVYNSDCVYANPSKRIFAISDPPGITTSSRQLFAAMDRYLKKSDDVQEIINRLNSDLGPDDAATLSLIYFPADRPGKAQILIAGDTFVFHGNMASHMLRQLSGHWSFMGTPHVSLMLEERAFTVGDFFIIASDGITSLKGNEIGKSLEEVFWKYIAGNAEKFVLSAMTACNRPFEQTVYDRSITRFGGNDNVSLLLVCPDGLIDSEQPESFILGGEVHYR